MRYARSYHIPSKSPSSRRAWIEISTPAQATRLAAVALLAEGVDRNCFWQEGYRQLEEVALLAEEVDRNDDVSVEDAAQMKVALLTEGVDRNTA